MTTKGKASAASAKSLKTSTTQKNVVANQNPIKEHEDILNALHGEVPQWTMPQFQPKDCSPPIIID